jgi:hypothetical protein
MSNVTALIPSNVTKIAKSKICKLSPTFKLMVEYYLPNSTYVIGLVLNLICIVCFVKIIKKEKSTETNMYKYLLLKSISDFTFDICFIPKFAYDLNDRMVFRYKYVGAFYIYFISRYIGFCVKLTSIFFELAASFDCVLFISQKLKAFRTKNACYIISVCITAFCGMFSIMNLLYGKIGSSFSKKYNSTIYTLIRPEIYTNEVARFWYYLFNSILRDILPLFLLMTFNVMILISLRRSTQRRQNLQKNNTTNNKSVNSARNAERNKIKMIVFTSLIHLLHIPIIIYNLSDYLLEICLQEVSVYVYELSYALPFFSYLCFNNTFRRFIFFWFEDQKKRAESALTRGKSIITKS